jgi:hypothetical protein
MDTPTAPTPAPEIVPLPPGMATPCIVVAPGNVRLDLPEKR